MCCWILSTHCWWHNSVVSFLTAPLLSDKWIRAHTALIRAEDLSASPLTRQTFAMESFSLCYNSHMICLLVWTWCIFHKHLSYLDHICPRWVPQCNECWQSMLQSLDDRSIRIFSQAAMMRRMNVMARPLTVSHLILFHLTSSFATVTITVYYIHCNTCERWQN